MAEATKVDYTNELQELIVFMETQLVDESPNYKLNPDYFILSILENPKSTAHKIMSDLILSDQIVKLSADYHEKIQKASLKIVNPMKKVSFNKDLQDAFDRSEGERKTLNDKKIGSQHILLSLLKNKDIQKIFSSVGLTYDILFNSLKSDIGTESTNNTTLPVKYENNKKADKNKIALNNYKLPQYISKYCTCLNKLAYNDEFDRLVGREKEINMIMKTLTKRNKNNVILVGLSGCGKTALVQGLAKKIENKEINNVLRNKVIISLDYTALLAGASYKGIYEDRIKNLYDEMKNMDEPNGKYILFIDDINISLDNSTNDITPFLINVLNDPKINVIGAITFKGYKNYISGNGMLERKFQKINIDKLSVDESIEVLKANKDYYEKYHKVKYPNDTIDLIVKLSSKYITEKQLPDSAIDILDIVGASKNINRKQPNDISILKEELSTLETKKVLAIKEEAYDIINQCNLDIINIKTKIRDIQNQDDKEYYKTFKKINANDIYNVISELSGVPINAIEGDEKTKLLKLEDNLKEEVIGQDEAIENITKAIYRKRSGVQDSKKPISYLFLGASGIGKTLLAKKLAKQLFGSEDAVIRLNMSEYALEHSVANLYGSPKGYVGSEQGGVLTEAVKRKPFSVILLDEFEKGHKKIADAFLQVFDEGEMSDNTGVKVDFKNTIIIMTSNIGSRKAQEFENGLGFNNNSKDKQAENKNSIIQSELKKFFAPEFINRIDDIITFNNLKEEDIKKIISLELNILKNRLKDNYYNIDFDDSILEHISKEIGDHDKYGARPIKRTIQNKIEDFISFEILKENIVKNKKYIFSFKDNKIEYNCV